MQKHLPVVKSICPENIPAPDVPIGLAAAIVSLVNKLKLMESATRRQASSEKFIPLQRNNEKIARRYPMDFLKKKDKKRKKIMN